MDAGRKLDWQIHTVVMGLEDVYYKPYSSDIAAAWQVVGHMNRKVPNEFQMMSEHGGYTAEFAEGHSCWAETAPLAICRAALAAIDASR